MRKSLGKPVVVSYDSKNGDSRELAQQFDPKSRPLTGVQETLAQFYGRLHCKISGCTDFDGSAKAIMQASDTDDFGGKPPTTSRPFGGHDASFITDSAVTMNQAVAMARGNQFPAMNSLAPAEFCTSLGGVVPEGGMGKSLKSSGPCRQMKLGSMWQLSGRQIHFSAGLRSNPHPRR